MAPIRRRPLLTELQDEFAGIPGDMPRASQEGVDHNLYDPATGTPTVLKTNQQHRSGHYPYALLFFPSPVHLSTCHVGLSSDRRGDSAS